MTDQHNQRPQRRLRHTALALAPRRPDPHPSLSQFGVSASSPSASTSSTSTSAGSSTKQSAFVFIKPHADTPSVRSLVSSHLTDAGCTITATATFSGPEIASEGFIDRHYYSSNYTRHLPLLVMYRTFSDRLLLVIPVASKATLLQPAELNVTPAVFADAFGTHFQQFVLNFP